MSKCILLSRVSSQHQTLDSQTEAIKAEAIKEGFKVEDMIIIEDKESAIKLTEEERHGLNTMKDYINKDKSITHVFIYELSRLSRRQLVLYSIRDYLIENKIQLICCTPYFKMLENGKLSQTANLMFSIFASMAESEMELKKERMIRGRQHNKLTGKISSGKPLIGYTLLEDKTIVIDDENKDFVIDLFTLYASGEYSITSLAKELCMRYSQYGLDYISMKPKIAWMLKNTKYCGDSQYPQLISKELFDKAQEVGKANRNNNKHFEKCDALLKKIIFSKKTGRHLTFAALTNKHRYNTNYETPMITVQTKHIDKVIWDLTIILHKAYVLDNEKIKKQIKKKIDINVNKMMSCQLNSKKAKEKIDKIEERVVYGKMSEEKADIMTKELSKKVLEFENEYLKIKEETDHLNQLYESDNLVDLPDYESFSQDEKIQLIRQMIKRIEIEKPSLLVVVAYVTTNVDGFLYTITINTRSGSSSMTSKMIL
jgi:DNA invertase Pin-like site-specific DNA recombinase